MRRLIVTEFMTLDGSIDEPSWSFPYWGDDIASFKGEENGGGDTLLLGRKTYQGFAATWPQQGDDEASGGKYFNNVEKIVVTKTLSNLEWNNAHVLQGDLVPGVKALKERNGKNIVVHGSGTLAGALIREGLVDQIRILLYPLLLGRGARLFEDGMQGKYRLVQARPMASGPIGLVYEFE
jgi:dihydrofolate reductase